VEVAAEPGHDRPAASTASQRAPWHDRRRASPEVGCQPATATLHGHMARDLDRLQPDARSNELLSIFFPMWNEEDYVERAIAESKAVCDAMVDAGVIGDYELIIVDDKSTDRTPDIADALAAADARVRVVHHDVNRKLGGSIKTGFGTARGDIVLYSDADLPFDFQEVPRALRLLRLYNADLISAYRFDRTGEGYTRAIYTFFYNLLIRTMFGVKARDINFAFKLVRRRVLEALELRSEGSFIDAELIIRAIRSGFELQQFGVDYFPRTMGESTLSSPGVITTIMKEMFTLRGELDAIKQVPKT
jgi:glycosyltransferase involved in cell wall biosynthesis